MDEHGIRLGACSNSRVIASSDKRGTYVKSPDSREWVSIIESISATGCSSRPLIISEGGNLQSTWFPDNIPHWQYTTSENGWTSNNIAIKCLQHMFIPETRPESGGRCLLIMDSHGSHTTVEFLCICKQKDVELLFYQPTPAIQIADLAKYDDAAQIKKENFINCYHLARSNTFNSRVLRSSWKAAGLFPWNLEKGLNSSQIQRPATRPTTPQSISNSNSYSTPRSSRTIYKAIQSIRGLGSVDIAKERSYIPQLREAGRVIDSLNAKVANLESENTRWKTQAASNSSNRRRRVPVDPNTTFASIESIVEARGSQALQEQRDALRGSVFEIGIGSFEERHSENIGQFVGLLNGLK
ncbi:hypothetical protein K3495_g1257 [Podosphaera aphanis]|nr:hypothetical protein K3495_g1257 [Podosphaera aphanis]